MRDHPAVGPLLLSSLGGLIFASVLMIVNRARDPDLGWFLAVLMPLSGLAFAAAMFSWFYVGVLRPAMAAPPPSGFPHRKPNWRQWGLLGDGRPFSATTRRTGVAVAAVLAVVGIVVAVSGFALAPDVTLVALGVMLLMVAVIGIAYLRYRRIPRPPYSTWLDRAPEPLGPDRGNRLTS